MVFIRTPVISKHRGEVGFIFGGEFYKTQRGDSLYPAIWLPTVAENHQWIYPSISQVVARTHAQSVGNVRFTIELEYMNRFL